MPDEDKNTSCENDLLTRSLRNTHTGKHSRNPGGNSSQAPNKQLMVKTKGKPWPCLVMNLNSITIAWNFGFLEYSSSHSRGIKAKIRLRKKLQNKFVQISSATH